MPDETDRKRLFIASEVRSGSTFLSESIAYQLERLLQLAMWDLTREPFADFGVSTPEAYILDKVGSMYTDASGWSSAKILCKALSVIVRAADDSAEVARNFFGDRTYWIIVRRRDRIAQATSLAVAERSGLYHYYGEPESSPDNVLDVSGREIFTALRKIVASDVFLELFAAKLDPARSITVFYEDFRADVPGHLNRIFRFIGVDAMVEPEEFHDLARIRPSAPQVKASLNVEFKEWLLRNYI